MLNGQRRKIDAEHYSDSRSIAGLNEGNNGGPHNLNDLMDYKSMSSHSSALPDSSGTESGQTSPLVDYDVPVPMDVDDDGNLNSSNDSVENNAPVETPTSYSDDGCDAVTPRKSTRIRNPNKKYSADEYDLS